MGFVEALVEFHDNMYQFLEKSVSNIPGLMYLCNEKDDKIVLYLVGGAACTLFAVQIGRKAYKWHTLDQLRREKREACKECKRLLKENIDSNKEKEKWDAIVKLSSENLIQKLKKRQLNPVDVLKAFQSKALEVDEDLNCIVEPILEAEQWALERSFSGDGNGLLYGVPISLKDSYGVEKYDQTIGLVSFINNPFTEDAVIVKVLKKQGAVPFMKTNSVQALCSFECSNPIFGKTSNPHDHTRTSGGSSGGEGALLGAGGSIIGFGSDIGGSIRIPAGFCGVYGIKPTIWRISKVGMHPLCRKNMRVASSIGPMARDMHGLVTAMRAILSPYMYELDPNCVPILFQDNLYNSTKPLTIGYYTYDGFCNVVPSHIRAVLEAKVILEKRGHKVVEWKIPRGDTALAEMWYPYLLGDNWKGFSEELDDDVKDPCIAPLYYIQKIPVWLRKILISVLHPVAPNFTLLLKGGSHFRTVFDWFKAVRELETWREEVSSKWKAAGLDAVISPSFSMPAPPHGGTILQQISYTVVYNALNFPAGVVPLTKVTNEDLVKLEDEYPDDNMFHDLIKKGSRNSVGLPVAVQVAALPFQDELCLRVMKEIDSNN